MRNRIQPSPDVIAEVVAKRAPDEQHDMRLDALSQKLDKAMLRIDALDTTLAKQKVPELKG